MKRKKFGKITLMFAIIVLIAQAGMQLFVPPPEKARADEYIHTIYTRTNGNPTAGVMVRFRTYQGGQLGWVEEPTTTDALGRADYQADVFATYWQAKVDDARYAANPAGWQNIIYPDDDIVFEVVLLP